MAEARALASVPRRRLRRPERVRGSIQRRARGLSTLMEAGEVVSPLENSIENESGADLGSAPMLGNFAVAAGVARVDFGNSALETPAQSLH